MFFKKWFQRSEPIFLFWESWLIHLVTVFGFLIAVLSAVYAVYRITPTVIGLSLVCAFVIGWATMPKKKECRRPEEYSPYPRATLWVFGAVGTSLLTLIVLWLSRTEEAIASPWQATTSLIFVFYILSALFAVRVARTSTSRWSLPVIMLFGLATWGVSVIIYRLGFGYDPFVHQATERHILEHGFILPKQMMYLGQYVTVVTISWVTHLSIHRVDRMLVPALSVFFMLPLLFTAMRYGWMKRMEKPALGLMALFAIPIGYFTFTVPFNFAFIFLILIIAFLPLSRIPRIEWLIASCGLASLAIHPLIGIPAVILAANALIRKYPSWITSIMIPLSLFAAFTVYMRMQGASIAFPSVAHFGETIHALFGLPYELYLGKPYLSIFYALLYASPILLLGVSIYGYLDQLSKTDERIAFVRMLGYTTIGILLGAVLIPLCFKFPNIINSEQYEFSLRLVAILPYLWLPGIAYALHAFFSQKTLLRNAGVSWCIAIVLLGSWYVSYPQLNDISYLPSPGLSRGDLNTVEFIDGNAGGIPYAVLAPQMLGAAALMDFGFGKQIPTRDGRVYAYSIPTGGMLYNYYLRLIATEEEPKIVQFELQNYADAPLIYVVVPASWDPEQAVMKRLEPITLAQYAIGGNRIIKLKAMAR